MAKIKQGILGGFSGAVANVVGSSWKGIAVMKSKPLSVANPRTPKQVAQRHKFKAGQALASNVKSALIIPLWNPLAQKMSGYNLFMSENVSHFGDTGVPELVDIKTTIGKLAPVKITDAYLEPVNKLVKVEWDKADVSSGVTDGDTMIVCLIDVANHVVTRPINEQDTFSLGLLSIDVGSSDLDFGAKVVAYLSWKRPGRTETCDSDNFDVVV